MAEDRQFVSGAQAESVSPPKAESVSPPKVESVSPSKAEVGKVMSDHKEEFLEALKKNLPFLEHADLDDHIVDFCKELEERDSKSGSSEPLSVGKFAREAIKHGVLASVSFQIAFKMEMEKRQQMFTRHVEEAWFFGFLVGSVCTGLFVIGIHWFRNR